MTRMPQVTARDLVRFLKSQGFKEERRPHLPQPDEVVAAESRIL
jgi:hypothetical protein